MKLNASLDHHSLDTVYKCNMTYCDSESCCSSHYDANVDYSEDYNYDWIYYNYPEYGNYGMEYTHGVQKGERRDHGFQGQVSTQSPQSQTIPYCYNPQSPMMKHPSQKNDELQKSRDQVRCLCRKFKEQEKDEPQDKLSFDKLVRNDEHLIQDVPWELGGIPNIQDDDMGDVRVHPRPGAYAMSRYLQSSNVSTRGHSRGMGPC